MTYVGVQHGPPWARLIVLGTRPTSPAVPQTVRGVTRSAAGRPPGLEGGGGLAETAAVSLEVPSGRARFARVLWEAVAGMSGLLAPLVAAE